MPRGIVIDPKIKQRAVAARRAGERIIDIAKSMGLEAKTVGRWCGAAGLPDGRSGKTRKKAKPSKPSPMGYLADQLAEMTKLIRKALPDLARFTLTTTPDGKAKVEYTVRQLSEVSGTVKL